MKIKTLLSKIEPDFLNQYLSACGVQDVEKYLKADISNYDNPFDYPTMDKAIAVSKCAFDMAKKVGIVIDCDADGYCSAAIVYQFLQIVNPEMEIQIFNHEGKQHGLKDLWREIAKSKVEFLIVPDAGTNDVTPCRHLCENGIDVLILDHHEIEKANPYAVVVNPHSGNRLNSALSGAGVADKWVQAYCYINNIAYPHYENLVAVSLATDICSMASPENRTYMQQGLSHLEFENPFIAYLFEHAYNQSRTPEGISLGIAPLANALARSDCQDKKDLFFYALNSVSEIEFAEAMKKLRAIKSQQDKRVKTIVDGFDNVDLTHKVVTVFVDKQDAGYTGLIANRLCSTYRKPVFVLREKTDKTWSGSLRSPFALLDIVNASKLAKCSGHLAACGIEVKKQNLEPLISYLDEVLNTETEPPVEVTACLAPSQVTLNFCELCQDNAILWGKDIPAPTWYFECALSKNDIQVLGKKQNTIKFVKNGVEFIKFNADEKLLNTLNKSTFMLKMVYKLSVNEWQGVKKPQAIIEQYEIVAARTRKENLDFEDIF